MLHNSNFRIRHYFDSRSGMALIIVLILTSILMISSLSLFRAGKEYRNQIRKAVREVQAQYMAASALQHAELKVRYFPTELYDASEYSQGKNPYFDFTELTDTEYNNLAPERKGDYYENTPHFRRATQFNNGPRFISDGTISADSTLKWFHLTQLDTQDTDPALFPAAAWFPTDGWPKEDDGKLVLNSNLYLWKYRYDITNRDTVQPALACATSTTIDPLKFDISTDNGFPYNGFYEVVKMNVLSIEGQKRMNREAIQITAVGNIFDPITNERYSQRLQKVIRVNRR